MINCGERKIQKLYRISLRDICEEYYLKEGDRIEVYIKIPEGRDRKNDQNN